MTRVRLDIAYDGTEYAGWQTQSHQRTIQSELEGAICTLTGEETRVFGSGRTDRGVHARNQVAHLDLEECSATATLMRSLNALLPPDIRIQKVRKVEESFHARFGASSKEYRYFIRNCAVLPPFERRYRTHVRKQLDVSAMKRAADLLVGEHDFAAFTANPNRVVRTTVRELIELSVKKEGTLLVVKAVGSGFLYKMVRSLAGLLIKVGDGTEEPQVARTILQSKIRTARVPTAHPQGLFLWNVSYAPMPH